LCSILIAKELWVEQEFVSAQPIRYLGGSRPVPTLAIMGCLPSKLGPIWLRRQAAAPTSTETAEDSSSKTYSWDKRKKVDPAEYTIENIKNEEVGRLP
ncbi:hypothetical protein Avbf_15923, partial [Armadillidium vulgare]